MKKSLVAAALALSLTAPSCLGPDNLYHSVKNWNVGLSSQDWVNEVVFLGMLIIPVYPIALLGDVLILNPIGYWTSKDTINDPGPFPGFKRNDA